MKKLLKNSNGSALIIAVAVVMIFAVLGLSLMTLTASGIAKNENRESFVQATDLADKGIEFAVKNLQKKLEDQIKLTPMGKSDFAQFLDTTLKATNLQCPITENNIPENIGYKIPGENNTQTKVCIEKVEYILTNGIAEEKDLYKRNVTFKSIGLVNRKEHITRSQVTLGTDAIPDQLKYAVSSNDEGNIFLHGGVEIQGDIKTDGNLIVSNKASIGDIGNFSWASPTSVHARLIKNVDSVTPKIILRENSQSVNKDIYFLKSNSRSYNNHINVSDSTLRTNRDYEKYNPNLPEVKNSSTYDNNHSKFFYSENISIHRRNLPQDSLDVPKIVRESINLTGISKQGAININSVSNFNSSVLRNAIKDSRFFYQEEYRECVKYSGKYNQNCDRYETRTRDADVIIAPQNKSSNNAVEIKGTHYITGNLTIDEAKIASDAILYVSGNVTIVDSVLNSLNGNGTLIIFANGTISLSNISRYLPTASKINAFLYSKQELRIYGSGSNIEITGGVSGNKVILSGIRGISSSSRYEYTANQLKTITNSSGKTIPEAPSRLKIIYDQDLIEAYTSFKRDEEEEFITEINEPEIINRY